VREYFSQVRAGPQVMSRNIWDKVRCRKSWDRQWEAGQWVVSNTGKLKQRGLSD